MKTELIEIISQSQDGNPAKLIAQEAEDGRLVNVTDNLNRLIADAINNAVESNDLDTLARDFDYVCEQMRKAHEAVCVWIMEQEDAKARKAGVSSTL